ncbi:hypothetical protein [Candidatus Methylomicrobium oryzae]|jgi:hypothetical protein|uniref:hypothetical protein n=1 Tax=Candidatus Methylomicrobium oryzae TaxID=2802053 RepID=UPI001921A935|nr:hypothetical protein [Methylomicrobium sp. RS1]MBL1262693.1 hypothetical protein [Methylomicrobium sp. RS1]
MKFIYAILFVFVFSAAANAGCKGNHVTGKAFRVFLTDISTPSTGECVIGSAHDSCTIGETVYEVDSQSNPIVNKDCSFTLTGIVLTPQEGSPMQLNFNGQISADKLSVVGQFTTDTAAFGTFSGLRY